MPPHLLELRGGHATLEEHLTSEAQTKQVPCEHVRRAEARASIVACEGVRRVWTQERTHRHTLPQRHTGTETHTGAHTDTNRHKQAQDTDRQIHTPDT